MASNLLREIEAEIERQDQSWGLQDYVPDERWVEIVTDEFNDLRWAVRICASGSNVEKENHDVPHELVQTIATLARWLRVKHG